MKSKSKKIIIIVSIMLIIGIVFTFGVFQKIFNITLYSNVEMKKTQTLAREDVEMKKTQTLAREYENQATKIINEYFQENNINGEISNLYCQCDEYWATGIVNANLTINGENFDISVDVPENTTYCNYKKSELSENLKNYIIDRLKANSFDIPEDIELHMRVHSGYIYGDFVTEDSIKTIEDILNSNNYGLSITLKYIDNQNIDLKNADISFLFDDKLSDIRVNLLNFKNEESYISDDIAEKWYSSNQERFSIQGECLKEYSIFETEYIQGSYDNLHSIEYVNYDNLT